jgi:hypothetical protein
VGSSLTLVKLTGVSDGNGGTETSSFQVYRPAGLPRSGQRAPALLLFGGSGGCGATISSPHWQPISNHGQDAAFFNDSSGEQHLTVPQLTEYMAHRLRCPAPKREGTLGPTVPGQNKTVRFRVEGPCGSWIARGPAVEGFEVIGGAHEWSCQDSFTPYIGGPCNDRTSPTAPLSGSGRPLTDGLDLEQQEWHQMAAGVSYR